MLAGLLLALLGCVPTEGGSGKATATGSDSPIRIGTWNLENLGSRDQARSQADFAKIAQVIRQSEVQVLALQEVNGAQPLRQLLQELGSDYSALVGTSGLYRSQGKRIGLGFLWNHRQVQLLHCDELQDLPRRSQGLPIFHRLPLSAAFAVLDSQGKRRLDFRAVNIHLKASFDEESQKKRLAEVQELRRYLQGLLKEPDEDRDILVMGDFNHGYSDPAFARFTANGLVTYLRPDRPSPTIMHFAKAIDHIALAKGNKLKVTYLSVHHVPKNRRRAWRQSYSDHFPVTLQLEHQADLDPQAKFRPARHPLASIRTKAR